MNFGNLKGTEKSLQRILMFKRPLNCLGEIKKNPTNRAFSLLRKI